MSRRNYIVSYTLITGAIGHIFIELIDVKPHDIVDKFLYVIADKHSIDKDYIVITSVFEATDED